MGLKIFDKGSSKMFDADIQPKCEYCHFGRINSEGTMVQCDKKGMVSLDFQCKAFTYSPLKRVPKKQFAIPGNFDRDEA